MMHVKASKETLARIRLAEEEATRTFGSPELAKQWMAKNNLALGCSPVAMLASEMACPLHMSCKALRQPRNLQQ